MYPKLSGIFVALPTPYLQNETLDHKSFEKYVNWLTQKGIRGLVPSGTTGESVALNLAERQSLIEICQAISPPKTLIIPGTGAATTAETLQLTQQAETLKSDAALIITPYFVNATPESMYQHYKTVHDQTNIPIILYNNPARTGVNLTVETILKLMELPRIVGIKEASPDLSRPLALVQGAQDKNRQDFSLLSGTDETFLAFMAQGGHGIISVAAGLAPVLYESLFLSWSEGKIWQNLYNKAYILLKALGNAPNPTLIKYALAYLGIFQTDHSRLPIPSLTTDYKKQIESALEKLEISCP